MSNAKWYPHDVLLPATVAVNRDLDAFKDEIGPALAARLSVLIDRLIEVLEDEFLAALAETEREQGEADLDAFLRDPGD